MSRDLIIIADYDPAWPGLFADQAATLRQALGPVALRIDHIGSTSVVGLAAKPIIDVQISVASLEPVEPFRAPLESLGYVFHGENPELTKRYFREPPGTRRTHLHARRAGSFSEQFALLFRDYLRAHPDEAAAYARLKHELAATYREDREGYTDAKQPYVYALIARADTWAQATGWQPGPSDA
ncbi:MAG TPA: GrpB family protein [Ktedonobacterales bacterium]